jgi:hypothetical protein
MTLLRRARTRLASSLVTAAAGTAALVMFPGAAVASPPDTGSFSSHTVFQDTDVCAPEGFTVDVIQDENTNYRVFFDQAGEVAFVEVHVDYRAVISANDHTIVERDKWTDFYYADGTAKTVGDTVHIQGPGAGLVQHDAGRIIFNPDGSVAGISGPHPQFEGQTFCFALLP